MKQEISKSPKREKNQLKDAINTLNFISYRFHKELKPKSKKKVD
jgi:hypothetical protein